MPEPPRLLFVHAHPDDESLGTGATIAHYAARGANVRVVTCTLGEEGEVIGDRWAELAVDRADQLGGYRIGELTAALRALGVSEPRYLGGAGRWRDSGMAGTETRRRRRFVDADDREAVGALVAIIRQQRPHVVVTYDPNGGYGHPDHIHTHQVTSAAVAAAGSGGPVKAIAVDDAALQLAYASKVIIVPGYGLAAAQAQYECRELAEVLESHGVDVSYAIHPVAGRMPGHMNVLLAEANVPYDQLKEMDEVNSEFERTDVALVVGANDVTNPAARRPGNAVSGMPILNVDHAKSIIVIKRSMASGYAGIDNELYTDPKTSMFFADAKKGLAALVAAAKTLVA